MGKTIVEDIDDEDYNKKKAQPDGDDENFEISDEEIEKKIQMVMEAIMGGAKSQMKDSNGNSFSMRLVPAEAVDEMVKDAVEKYKERVRAAEETVRDAMKDAKATWDKHLNTKDKVEENAFHKGYAAAIGKLTENMLKSQISVTKDGPEKELMERKLKELEEVMIRTLKIEP